MRSSIALASFTALAAGTVGVGALDSVPSMAGSDTLKELTIAVLNSCGANCRGVSGGSSGTYGITYIGTGSGNGQSNMSGAAPTQGIAPMSRPINNGVCSTPIADRAGAEGLVVALDAVNVVANSANAGAEGVDYTGTAGNPGNDWRNVLRQIYAGMPTGQNNIFQRDCNSASRRAILSNWDNVFRGTVNSCADSHPSFAGTAPNRYDPNDAIVEPGVRHAFRRDEESGTTEVFLTLLQLPTVNFAVNGPAGSDTVTNAVYRALAASPFCNVYRPEDDYQPTGLPANPALGFNASRLPEMTSIALPAGIVGTGLAPHYPASANPRNLSPYLPEFMDQDPVRRQCVGSIGNQVTANATNLPFEQVCSADGRLGVVLPINPPPSLSTAAAYPSQACDAALGFHAGPAVLRPNGQAVRCPNGDVPLDAKCLLPVRSAGAGGVAFDCLNGRNAPPAVTDVDGNGSTFADAPGTDGRTDIDGRVYNLVLRDAAGNPLTINRPNPQNPVPPPLATPLVGSFYRIHTTRSLLLPPNATLASSLCTRDTATDQIGCLSAASPCSIGFAGGGAAAGSVGVTDLLVNGVAPSTVNVQNLVTGGGLVYPFARKLYVNSVRGFGNLNSTAALPNVDPTRDAETELIRAFSSLLFNGTINVANPAFGFVPLPGGSALCEDLVGTSLCSDASNTDACAGNPAGIPSSSCTNGAQDGDETAIDVCPAVRPNCVAGVCSP